MRVAGLVSAAGFLFNVNCGGSSNGTGTGGHGGAAGHAGSTGSAGSGGTTGSGGAAGSGGTAAGTGGQGGASGGSGGAAGGPGTAGATGGTGGATGGTGGAAAGSGGHAGGAAAGSGGDAGGAGGSKTDGGATTAAFPYNFDTTIEGYALATNVVDASVPPSLTWDSAVGNPTPGSLELTNTFTDYSQILDVALAIAPFANLMGKTIHAKVRLDGVVDGGTVFTAGSAQVHASSDGFIFANGDEAILDPGVWTDVVFNLSSPAFAAAGFDPTQIMEVAVRIVTNSGPEGGAFPGPETLTFHIDSIVAQ